MTQKEWLFEATITHPDGTRASTELWIPISAATRDVLEGIEACTAGVNRAMASYCRTIGSGAARAQQREAMST